MADESGSRRWVGWLAGATFVGILFQLWIVSGLETVAFFPKYWALAEDLLRGELSRERLNDVSPLYLWTISLARGIGASLPLIRIGQIVTSGAVILLSSLVALRLAGRAAAAATALALIGSHMMFLNAAELEPEALILLLNTLGLFFLIGRPAGRWPILAGALFFGLSATARPVVLPGALLVLAVILVFTRERRSRSATLAMAGLALPLLLAMVITWLLTGHASIMNPGTVFYEGMNPHARGYALIEPLIVSDVRAEIDEPDPLHASYRRVASRAAGEELSAELSNRYWRGKAVAFLTGEPGLALELISRKFLLSLQSESAWDIGSTVRRERETDALPWIPFGVLVALAGAAIVTRRRDPAIIALVLFAGSQIAIMTMFYVSGRQRNAIVSAVAILAGIGLSQLISLFRRSPVRAGITSTFVAFAAIALSFPTHLQNEAAYGWTASFRSEAVVQQRNEAESRGDDEAAMRFRAIDRTWLIGDDPHIPTAPRKLVGLIARGELSQVDSPQRMFDLALALQYAGDYALAEELLGRLDADGYRPMRGAYVVSSVAWYRGIGALAGGERNLARAFLARAASEAPADPNVLAMQWVMAGDHDARAKLDALHDPMTAQLAIARMHLDLGNLDEARRHATAVADRIPEWNRARLLAQYLEDRKGEPSVFTSP